MLSLVLALALQDPADLLADSQRALLELAPLSVRATLSRTQALTWESHLIEGTLVLDPARGAFRVDASVRELRTDAKRSVSLLRDGERYLFLNHDAKTYVAGDSPALGALDARLCYDLAQLFPVDPADLAARGEPALREPLLLAGRRCTTLIAKLPDGPLAVTLYLDDEDGLPRLWQSARDLGEGDTLQRRYTVHAIERHVAALPLLAIPEGYEPSTSTGWQDPEAGPKRAKSGSYISLAEDLAPLRERFNREKDRVRVLGLFAPT
jgi:hypothetical protein